MGTNEIPDDAAALANRERIKAELLKLSPNDLRTTATIICAELIEIEDLIDILRDCLSEDQLDALGFALD